MTQVKVTTNRRRQHADKINTSRILRLSTGDASFEILIDLTAGRISGRLGESRLITIRFEWDR
jgi:hypothetical protein